MSYMRYDRVGHALLLLRHTIEIGGSVMSLMDEQSDNSRSTVQAGDEGRYEPSIASLCWMLTDLLVEYLEQAQGRLYHL